MNLESDCFSQTPPTILTLKTNKKPKMVLFPEETGRRLNIKVNTCCGLTELNVFARTVLTGKRGES
jgi:hypothetical protein